MNEPAIAIARAPRCRAVAQASPGALRPAPAALMAVLALAALPLVGSSSTWLTLTVAGLAMGMIIFIAPRA